MFIFFLLSLKIALEKEQGQKARLEAEASSLQNERREVNKELESRIQELEGKCTARETELEATKEKQVSHDQAAKRAIAALQKEMTLRIDQVQLL